MRNCTKQSAMLQVVVWSGMLLVGIGLVPARGSAQDEASEKFFEQEVRPILAEQCSRCHGSQEQSGGLRVDQRQALIDGGDTAPAVVPGHTSESLLLQAVRRSGDLAMPPDKSLSEHAIRVLERWIEIGAPWPANQAFGSKVEANNHWAFQPLHAPSIPPLDPGDDTGSVIDAFVIRRLAEEGLSHSPLADRRTLIRRVFYSLTGLPPSPDDVEQFVQDRDPAAYEKLVERLLASPQYGEQWARHWLDVARYSDTKGYVYAREERYWVHAWAYRDWVAAALNNDMPYDRFLLLQLAADQVEDRQPSDLAAMGFLTLGRRFLGVQRDIIDDRIDVVCRATMGLTVSCARCHDHKYDPIESADYYSLYGVFDSCIEKLEPLENSFEKDAAFEEELSKRLTTMQEKLDACREESSERARNRVADYLRSQTELHKYPADGFDQIFEEDDLLPAFVRRWESYLRDAARRSDPVFAAWHAYAVLPSAEFATRTVAVTQRLRTMQTDQLNRLVAQAFEQPPESFDQVCQRYAALLLSVKKQWEAELAEASKSGAPMDRLADMDAEALRLVLYGPQSPCKVPEGSISNSETHFDSKTCTDLWKLQGEVDRWIINSKSLAPHALTLVDQATPNEPRIFLRGNPLTQGRDVPRQFLSLLAGPNRKPFQNGSGRYELAQAIIEPGNPLTARVIVNRVWAAHFGQGLVSTPSDFGVRAEPPSHPELLDWLSAKLISDQWSLKQLHRWIVLSETFQQSSFGPVDSDARRVAMQTDPANRLLWRANSKRLSFEEFRDSLLATAAELDSTVGGKSTDLFAKPYPKRRTLYGLVDRQYLPGTLRMFDFANPDLHVASRSETTVPQQSLFLMNHPLVLERVRALANFVKPGDRPQESVRALFRQVLQREPSELEIADAVAFVNTVAPAVDPHLSVGRADWQYGYGGYDSELDRTTGFTPLPHFTGQAWQGGAKWPDAELGWVQLTAEGGHPGNDRKHAAIRRWTAPQNMTVRVQSKIQHDPTQGDGIRALIVSSQHGTQQSRTIHHDAAELNVESLQLVQGDTLDFLVDIGDVLNSDQYRWQVSIQAVDLADAPHWNSFDDFPRDTVPVPVLDAWEQLAQVLLCSNEFMYVD